MLTFTFGMVFESVVIYRGSLKNSINIYDYIRCRLAWVYYSNLKFQNLLYAAKIYLIIMQVRFYVFLLHALPYFQSHLKHMCDITFE